MGVVGLGLIGGSIARAIRRADTGVSLVGVDPAAATTRAARASRVFDALSNRLDTVRSCDLVVLAAPVGANVGLLDELARGNEVPRFITDAGSTKAAIVRAAEALPAAVTFVGGHPVAGVAASGFGAARADLFEGRPWLLTPRPGTPARIVARFDAFARALGAQPHLMDPEDHDRLMAIVSHLPQLAATVLMQLAGVEAGPSGLQHAGPGLADTTRLAESSPRIWIDICAANRDAIGEALDKYGEALCETRRRLDDPLFLEQLFRRAQESRKVLVGRRGVSR